MTLKEVRAWELEHNVKIPAIKRLMRKEAIQKKVCPYCIDWDKMEVQVSDIYKQAKEALINIQKKI